MSRVTKKYRDFVERLTFRNLVCFNLLFDSNIIVGK